MDAPDEVSMKNWLQLSRIEVLVMIEGTDSLTGMTCQARHSYTYDDLAFDATFEPCVSSDPETGGCIIDYSKFHQVSSHQPSCVAGLL